MAYTHLRALQQLYAESEAKPVKSLVHPEYTLHSPERWYHWHMIYKALQHIAADKAMWWSQDESTLFSQVVAQYVDAEYPAWYAECAAEDAAECADAMVEQMGAIDAETLAALAYTPEDFMDSFPVDVCLQEERVDAAREMAQKGYDLEHPRRMERMAVIDAVYYACVIRNERRVKTDGPLVLK